MKEVTSFTDGFSRPFTLTDFPAARSIYKPRDPFANKGTFGHALLLAGSYGKIGAALMAAKACLTSGAGLLTAHLPACGYSIMQAFLPEAMVTVDSNKIQLTQLPKNIKSYKVVGAGPGIGTSEATATLIKTLLGSFPYPMVLDADALNILSKNKKLLSKIPRDSILTPHPKEFDRLFGTSEKDAQRFELARANAVKYRIILVLKGHYTGIFCPDGRIFFNTSGNAGMAKGGSGDVLTGMMTAMLAQSYPPVEAARLGVYLHGLAGDIASERYGEEAMLPTDLIACIGKGFQELKKDLDH
jgi:NAD(P)H-hydrate epimerase